MTRLGRATDRNNSRWCLRSLPDRLGWWRGLSFELRMRIRLATQLLAFVTLETALFHELLRLGAQVPEVPVGEPAFLFLIDRVPLGTDIGGAGKTDLAVLLHRRCVLHWRIPVENVRDGVVDQRCPAVDVMRKRGWRCRNLGRDSDLVGFLGASLQRCIGLFVVLDIQLQSSRPVFRHNVVHSVDSRLGRQVLLAIDNRRHSSSVPIDADNIVLIAPRALDRRDVKTQSITCLVSTLDVDRSAALVARHTSSSVSLASLANLGKLRPRDRGNSFSRTQRLCATELDLRCPDRACDVHPIVIGRALQGLARVDRPIHLLLLLAVKVGRFLRIFALHSVSFSFLLRFLLVRDFRRLDKVMVGILMWAKHALVVLDTQVSINCTFAIKPEQNLQ